MSRRLISIISIVLLSQLLVSAQGPYPTADQIKGFRNTTLLVVLDGRDVAFDAYLKDAINKHWNISEFKFVDTEEFDAQKSNPNYSFLATLQVQFDRDPEEHVYHFLYVLLSHPTADLQEMPVIAQVPFLGSTLTSSSHLHKTEMLVKFIQNYTTQVVASNGDQKYRKLKHLNKGIRKLKSKTLILSEDQIDPSLRDEESLSKAYKHVVKLVSSDNLVDLMGKAEKGNVFIHLVAPDEDATSGQCFKMIIEPATGEAFFYKKHKINSSRPPVFLKRDFRQIRWYPIHWI